jgi:uncharacterized protein
MTENFHFRNPWLVAVWPGMGGVALAAGYYLMSKLGMHSFAEFSPEEIFDPEHVVVRKGLISPGPLPRSRFFAWRNPSENGPDIVLFLGESQPVHWRGKFCRRLIEFAKANNVSRVFTFAAMAANMRPSGHSRVFGAATTQDGVVELRDFDLELVNDGNISGMNGVLLGVAAESGLTGTCLLGEMPHQFMQLPYPRASLAVLKVFESISGIQIDLSELAVQADSVDRQLIEILRKAEQAMAEGQGIPAEPTEEPAFDVGSISDEPQMAAEVKSRIERLFQDARVDRSKAYVLKSELDRLGAFRQYEDRFLDLFRERH